MNGVIILTAINEAKNTAMELYNKDKASVRRIVLPQMVLSTICGAACFALTALPFLQQALLLMLLYISNIGTMMMLARLAALPDKVRFTALLKLPVIWISAIGSPLITVLLFTIFWLFMNSNALWGGFLLLNALAFALERPFLSSIILLILLFMLAFAYMMIYMASGYMVINTINEKKRLTAALFMRGARAGARSALSPLYEFAHAITYFLAAFLMALVLTAVAVYAFMPAIITTGSIRKIALDLLDVLRKDTWLFGLAALAGYTWMLGLGAVFWPKYRLAHVLHQKELIKRSELPD